MVQDVSVMNGKLKYALTQKKKYKPSSYFYLLIQFCSSGNNEPSSNSNVQTKENEITTSSTTIVKATNKVFSIQECLDWENNFDENSIAI